VIIACLNGAETLEEALASLARQETHADWEVVFVDNGSTDASRAIFDAFASRNPRIPTRVIDVTDAGGKAHALNVAIPQCGERLLFLDADDAVAPDWITAMAAALDRHPLVAARLDYSRLNSPEVQAARLSGVQKSLFRLPHYPFCAHAGGATLGFHRRVFEEVGPFDPRFVALEDTEWCVRAHLKGFRIAFAPKAVYYYRFRANAVAIERQSRAYARHMALLRKLYDRRSPSVVSDAAAWAGALLAATTVTAHEKLSRVRRMDPAARLRLAARKGDVLGDIEGARAFGVAPLRRGLGRTSRRLKRSLHEAAVAAMGVLRPTLFAVRTETKTMALTFDDGPDPNWTPLLLDRLKALGAKATFFLVGARALRHPDLVARILAEGHEIGNHSWSHVSLPRLSEGEVVKQLRRTRDALRGEGGALMRPPYGDESFDTNRIARAMGYRVTLWSVNGGDWLDDDSDTLSRRILDQARPGAIVLLHDSLERWEAEAYRDRMPTLDAVEKVIRALPDWRFMTVSAMLALGKPVERGWVKRTPLNDLAALGWDEDMTDATQA